MATDFSAPRYAAIVHGIYDISSFIVRLTASNARAEMRVPFATGMAAYLMIVVSPVLAAPLNVSPAIDLRPDRQTTDTYPTLNPPVAPYAQAPQNVQMQPTVQPASARTAVVASAPVAPVPSNDRSYKLGAGDEIRVTVFNEPDLKVEQKVAAEGEINMPLIGDVNANGRTSAELARSIEARLSKGFLREPKVSVTVITYRPFYVIGEVSRPGSYAFTPNLTVASAIATAGGFAKGASKGAVYVRRVGENTESKIKVSENMQLGPGDTIRVGRSALSTLGDLPLGLLGVLP